MTVFQYIEKKSRTFQRINRQLKNQATKMGEARVMRGSW